MTRKQFSSIVAAALALQSISAYSKPAEQPASLKVACVGDSITFGARIQDREINCYPAQLGRILGETWNVKKVHPNAAGAKIMAETIAAVITGSKSNNTEPVK